MAQYFFASSSSRFTFLSVDSSRFSATRRLSGNFTSPSLHNIPTSYLSHTCFTVLSKVSRALLSSREPGVTSSYFVPKDSVRHQSSTCLLNDSSTFRTRCACITCRRSGFTIARLETATSQFAEVEGHLGFHDFLHFPIFGV